MVAFPLLKVGIGLSWAMVVFAALWVAAIVFVSWLLPETKGQSVEEVVDIFEEAAAEHRPPAAVG